MIQYRTSKCAFISETKKKACVMRVDSERCHNIARLNVSWFRFWCILESLALASSLILSTFNACHRTTSLFWLLKSKPVPNTCKVAGTALWVNQQHASWVVKNGEGRGHASLRVHWIHKRGRKWWDERGRKKSVIRRNKIFSSEVHNGWAIKDNEGKTVLKLRFTL